MYDIKQLQTAMWEQGYNYLTLSRKARMPEATVRQLMQRGSGNVRSIKKLSKALGYELKDLVLREKTA